MQFLQELRQTLFDLRKRAFGGRRKRQPFLITPGLPESLPRETIESLCKEHFGGTPRSFRQQHLSGWKSSGAYRIFAELEAGKEVSLIYKIAIYNTEDIPALSGLPVQPGPAEFTILSHADGPLAQYLPTVYLAEAVEPGRLYRYIMEDLGIHYHRAVDEERPKAAALFPAFHDAMLCWDVLQDSGLIHYGRDFSTALQVYALPRFEQYAAAHNDDLAIRELLNNWSAIARIHLDEAFFQVGPHSLIHGDPNYSNVYLHKENTQKMKLVDWEWAGYGTPYADLVSFLKGAPSHLERLTVDQMAAHLNQPAAEAHRLFAWCQMERGILDAAFLSVQALNTEHQTRFSLHSAVTSSARLAIRAYQQLR